MNIKGRETRKINELEKRDKIILKNKKLDFQINHIKYYYLQQITVENVPEVDKFIRKYKYCHKKD